MWLCHHQVKLANLFIRSHLKSIGSNMIPQGCLINSRIKIKIIIAVIYTYLSQCDEALRCIFRVIYVHKMSNGRQNECGFPFSWFSYRKVHKRRHEWYYSGHKSILLFSACLQRSTGTQMPALCCLYAAARYDSALSSNNGSQPDPSYFPFMHVSQNRGLFPSLRRLL